MQIVARGLFQPSASSIALQRTSTSPRSKAARISASSRFGVSPETARALMPASWKRFGDVLGVLHAGRVEDPGDAVEAGLVEVGDRHVEGRLVEQRGQLLLVEVLVDLAFAQRHLGDRPHTGAGRDAHAAQRRDHAPARGLGEVEARGLGREEVGDVAGDQRPGRGHADEDRAGPVADAGAGFLPERGMRLVADHDRVRVGDLLVVADEPLVGLDGDRAVGVVAAVDERRAQALLVAAIGDLADELVDEVAAVGEDQDAAGARGLDEADRGDGLAGAGRVLEPEAALGAGVLRSLLDRLLRLLLGGRLLPVLGLLVGGQLLVLDRLIVVLRRPIAVRTRLVAVAPPPRPLGLARPRSPPGRRPPPFSAAICCSAINSVSVPESASTWCGFSSAPSSSFGGSSASSRSSPSSSEKSRRHWIDGCSAPSSISGRAASSARRRAVPGRQRLGALAVEQERLAGERRRPLDVGA